MSLSEDVKNYKTLQLAFHTKVPQKIVNRWQNYIIPKGLPSLGEKGADLFIGGRIYGEKTLVHHAIQAEIERQFEMANAFWKKAYELSLKKTKGQNMKRGKTSKSIKITGKDRVTLREWWHSVLYTHGKYNCYAVILVLPTDTQAIKYLTDAGKEINLLSRNNCLVIALSDTKAIRYGSNESEWSLAVNEQITNEQSIELADYFEIKFTEFPCMVIFEDIRTSNYLPISLQKMDVNEISQKMRAIFSTIQLAIKNNLNTLGELKRQAKKEEFQKAGRSVIGRLRNLAGKAIDAYIQHKINTAS